MISNNIIYEAPNPHPVAFDVLEIGKIFTPDDMLELPKHTYMKIEEIRDNGIIVNAVDLLTGEFKIFSSCADVYSLKGEIKVEYE